MHRAMFVLLTALIIATACAASAPSGPKIRVENAWARPAAASTINPGGMSGSETTSAVYFVIANEGSAPDALIGATTDIAMDTELHETRVDGNVAKMMPIDRVEVPAGGRVEFKPGGFHIMLMGLTQELAVGKSIMLTLKFEKSSAIALDVPIQMEK